MADRVAVMYAGKIVETGAVEDIFYRNAHPYTQALLKSLPTVDSDRTERLVSIAGTPPDLLNPPKGCAFANLPGGAAPRVYRGRGPCGLLLAAPSRLSQRGRKGRENCRLNPARCSSP